MDLDALLRPHVGDLERRLHEILDIAPWAGASARDPALADGLLDTMLAAHLDTGGKRLRALLPVGLVATVDGPVDAALTWGACVELVHNGTLVHDDIQDDDAMRRGKATLWKRYGVAQAINAGNALLTAPLRALQVAPNVPEALRAPLSSLLAGALFTTIRGQVADLAQHAGLPDADAMAAVYRAKTAPLFGAAFEGTALILGDPVAALGACAQLGEAIGMGFQVRDDLLDLVGTKGRDTAGADLREGKATWPTLLALARAPVAETAEFTAAFTRASSGDHPFDDVQLTRWTDWIRQHGLGAARDDLDRLLAEARGHGERAFARPAAAVIDALCDRLALLDG